MIDAHAKTPPPTNEAILEYAPGSREKKALKEALAKMSGNVIELPMVIGGKEITTGDLLEVRAPHAKASLLAKAHQGNATHATQAIDAAKKAHHEWSSTPFPARAAIFLKAADLLATRMRPVLNAATMLGQSKTAHQAEIDSACELIDFLRFNVHFAEKILGEQPLSGPGMWNQTDYRPLEGFVFASTPFNFTAIGGNLPSSVALMGNTVVWKPSDKAYLSAHYTMEIFREAGLPDGVINLVMGDPATLSNVCLEHPDLAGVHFTGSTPIFQSMWKKVGENMARYRTFPRLVGETGGKDFVFAHASSDVDALAVALGRGAFEYQGQKCSAASRAYVPKSIWPKLKSLLEAHVASIKVGDVNDFRNFMGAVIDARSYARLTERIAQAKKDPECSIVAGGNASDATGFFVHPTIIEAKDPKHRLMNEELFGPVLTLWVYDDAAVDEALALCDATSPYALTGAVFSKDRAFVQKALARLRFSAGNFYINDKPTGAVVGQQPFGGARSSGTNDKAGSALNLVRWLSPRTVKETFNPPHALGYRFLDEE